MTDYHGMMNIGVRPTFGGEQQTLEVHIMQYTGNLYGEKLHVAFLHRIRGERKFASPEELAVQLNKDKKQIEDLFSI
jgi:riboflavin kinase/FMN adenylyltransferase